MSFAYWSFNPNSGDTGGLVQGDWLTPQSGKLALLADLLAG
jgi:endoglucanase